MKSSMSTMAAPMPRPPVLAAHRRRTAHPGPRPPPHKLRPERRRHHRRESRARHLHRHAGWRRPERPRRYPRHAGSRPRRRSRWRQGPVLIAGHRVTRKDSDAKRWGSRIANSRARRTAEGRHARYRLRPETLPPRRPSWNFRISTISTASCRRCSSAPAAMSVSVPVRHHPRAHGASHYGTWDRLKVGIVDLFGVAWLQRRWNQPQIDPNP